jgi:protein ImuB
VKRLLCLRLPYWPIQRLRAERPELRSEPLLLLGRDPRRGAIVVEGCERARAAGVRPGTPLAEATAMLPPTTAVRLYDPAADLAALGRLAEYCEEFSPRVGWQTESGGWVVRWLGGSSKKPPSQLPQPPSHPTTQPPNHLFLDITGIPGLFGGERELADRVLEACRERDYAGRVAIAPTLGAAWAVASVSPVTHGGLNIIPRGGLLPALRPLPVESLRLPNETVDLLSRLGVDTVADLIRLPRAGLAVRFGTPLLLRLDQALGAAPEMLLPHRPPPVFEAVEEFDFPTDRRADIDWVLDRLIGRVTAELHAHGRGAIRVRAEFRCASYSLRPYDDGLDLSPEGTTQQGTGRVAPSGLNVFSHVQTQGLRPGLSCAAPSGLRSGSIARMRLGNVVTIEVALYRPTDLAKPVRELIRLHCDRLELPGPVDCIRLWADQTIPLRPRQEKLFTDRSAAADVYVAQLIERLSSRLGPGAVLRPVRRPDPLPERAVHYVPFLRRPHSKARKTEDGGRKKSRPSILHPPSSVLRPLPSDRPLRLFAPPIPVEADANSFRHQRRRHAIVRRWGPERIETGWWRGGLVRRDYYRVETTDGRRFWLFRDLTAGGWFLHGSFE